MTAVGMPICSGPLPATVTDCDARLAELTRQRQLLVAPESKWLATIEIDRILDRRQILSARECAYTNRRQAA